MEIGHIGKTALIMTAHQYFTKKCRSSEFYHLLQIKQNSTYIPPNTTFLKTLKFTHFPTDVRFNNGKTPIRGD